MGSLREVTNTALCCVQEEIRFLLCPELFMACLFTEELHDNECLVITGARQFSSYRGSSATFEWAGTYSDTITRDRWGRKEMQIVALTWSYTSLYVHTLLLTER